ncbi:hypothetical protein JXA88_06585 [Candidatus Fermentibacteria bacterium]|nr:hypothetical protein [Candidatus Fermentibacteria bacterium]
MSSRRAAGFDDPPLDVVVFGEEEVTLEQIVNPVERGCDTCSDRLPCVPRRIVRFRDGCALRTTLFDSLSVDRWRLSTLSCTPK